MMSYSMLNSRSSSTSTKGSISVESYHGIGRVTISESIIMILLFFLSISPMEFMDSNLLLIATAVYTAVVFFLRKKAISPIIFLICVIWFVINIAAYYRSISIGIVTFPPAFYMQFIRILLAYMMVAILGKKILYVFEKWLYKLAVISIPLYIGELFARPVYSRLAPFLNFATHNWVRDLGGWYSGLYTFDATNSGRNCGFSSEPGGYAVFLIVLIIIRFSINSIKIDKHVVIYLACIITTLSTTGYVIGFILILSYLISKAKYFVPLVLVPIVIFIFMTQIWGLDFIGPKIQQYYNEIDYTHITRAGTLRMSRFGILNFAVNQALEYPFGHGVFPAISSLDLFGSNITGANTYAILLLKWGWIGILMFLVGFWYTIKSMFKGFWLSQKMTLFIALALSITAYTFDTNVFFMTLLFYSIPFTGDRGSSGVEMSSDV